MALATKCPYCQTTFRVAHDQLKLRAGLVRCGSCKEIFNGIEHLLRPEEQGSSAPPKRPATEPVLPPSANLATVAVGNDQDKLAAKADVAIAPPAPAAAPSAALPSGVTPPIESPLLSTVEFTSGGAEEEQLPEPLPVVDPEASIKSAALASSLDFDVTPTEEPSIPEPLPGKPHAGDSALNDPLQRMTLVDFTDPDDAPDTAATATAIAAVDPNAVDELEVAIDDLQRKPWRDESKPLADADDPEASVHIPNFVKQGERQQRRGRTMRVLMIAGSVLLLVTLALQGAYSFRNLIAARFPTTKPLLADACAILHCQVGLPAQIDAVSIESSELQALPPAKDSFALTLLLRNRSSTLQMWPNIELTLNDANDKAIGRRVFTPRDYLVVPLDAAKGFAPVSEQPIKIPFQLDQMKASGFRVYVFYP